MVASGVENPTCEQIGPNTYRIEFQPTANSGAVEVFASSRPDRIDSEKPVGILRDAGWEYLRAANVRAVSISI